MVFSPTGPGECAASSCTQLICLSGMVGNDKLPVNISNVNGANRQRRNVLAPAIPKGRWGFKIGTGAPHHARTAIYAL